MLLGRIIVSTVLFFGTLILPAFLLPSIVSKSSHTHIQISHKEEYVPGTRDRKITIKGEPQAVESAYALINDKVSCLLSYLFTYFSHIFKVMFIFSHLFTV